MEEKRLLIVAAIEIGSHTINMKIAELSNQGIKPLEEVTQITKLGHNAFKFGHIQFETIVATSETLLGFKQLMQDYGVQAYRVVATTALGKVDNRDYVLDQLLLKTGLDIQVIQNSEERWLTYKAIRERIPYHRRLREEGVLIADVGSDSLEITLYNKGTLASTFNLLLGSQRLRKIMSNLERETLYFPKLMEEYLGCSLDRIQAFLGPTKAVHFIILSREIFPILTLLKPQAQPNQLAILTREELDYLYNKLCHATNQELARELDLHETQAELLLPTILTVKMLLVFTQSQDILIPLVYLKDGILSNLYDQHFGGQRDYDFQQDMVMASRKLGQRYNYDENHAIHVEHISLLLFDALKKIHGLGPRQRLLLQLAAILHDIGKFINFRDHHYHSYHIISYSDILGLSGEELQLIANVARYHSHEVPDHTHSQYQSLLTYQRVVVAKLAAIIRIADALDQSHRQKVESVTAQVVDNRIAITIVSHQDTLLEELTFKNKSRFFADVFGLHTTLIKKRND